MYRTVRYDPTEICCRYLTTNRFEDYIKQKFGNPKLPYGKDLSNFFNELSIFSQFFIWIADDLYNSPQLIFVNSIEDLLHPIDKNASPIEPGEKLHLPYWLGYIIVESINGHENIENFLLEDDGLKNFKRKIERTAKRYKEKNIADIFNRVSYYKTATHRIHCAIKPINLTHGEIAVFLIEHLGVEEELLVNDMNELLSFHWQWKNDFR